MFKISTVARPYLLITPSNAYPLSSQEAQRLIDYKLAHNKIGDFGLHHVTIYTITGSMTIRPATIGGGPAFEIEAE